MKKLTALALVLLLAATLFGCKSEPPKCGDVKTLDGVRQLLVENMSLDPTLHAPADQISKEIVFKNPHAVDSKEAIKQLSCQTDVVIGEHEWHIDYTSQLNDNDNHLVGISMPKLSLVQMRVNATEKIRRDGSAAKEAARMEKVRARQADGLPLVGTWKNDTIELIVKQGTKSTYSAELFVETQSGCTGGVSGLTAGPPDDSKLTIINDDNQSCIVGITFDGNTATVTETQGCREDHGAACSFEGTITKVN